MRESRPARVPQVRYGALLALLLCLPSAGCGYLADRALDFSDQFRATFGMGTVAGAHLRSLFNAPVLFAVDGVCDASGRVWWLEMNSNPILPPDGYAPMFNSLFGGSGS